MVPRLLSALIRRVADRRPPGRAVTAALWTALLLLAAGMHFRRVAIDPLPSRDSERYIRWAETIARGSCREAFRTLDGKSVLRSQPPLLWMTMAAGIRAGGSAEGTGRALMLFADLLLCAALGAIARELWRDWRLTAAALLCAAVLPICVKYPVHILRDPLYWCFAAWFLCFAMRAASGVKSLRNWCFAALCAALAILTRREGIELLLIAALWFLLSGWRSGALRSVLPRKLAAAAVFFGVVLLTVLPVERAMAECGSLWRVGQFSAISVCWGRLR